MMKNILISENDSHGFLNRYFNQRVLLSRNSLWVSSPGHRKGKVLQLRPNPFTMFRDERFTGTEIAVTSSDKNAPVVYYNTVQLQSNFSGFPQRVASFDQSEIVQATNKWYSKAASFSLNAAEIYATRKQTVDLVTKTTYRIAHAAGFVAKRNWRGACNVLGITYRKPRRGRTNPPEAWLEYSYGWAPLLSDIYTAIDHPWPEVRKTIKARHNVSKRTIVNGSNSSVIKNARWQNDFKGQITVQGTVTVTGTALAAASSVGLSNPLSLGWELLPFSFVVDWFLPIGPYLESLTALGGCVVTEKSTTQTYTTRSLGTAQTNLGGKYFNRDVVTKTEYHRKDRSTDFVTRPYPQLKNPFSFHHFSLAASLLAVNMKAIGSAKRFK